MHRLELEVNYWFCAEIAKRMITIERVTRAECELVKPLLERFFAEEGFDIPRTQVGDQLVKLIEATESAVFMAQLDELPVGVATVTTSSGIELGLSAELEDLYVLPDARGAGVGSALIGAVKAWCRARGCSLVAVVVTPGGQAAHNLVEYYRGRGFEPSERTLLLADLRTERTGRAGYGEETETA